MTKREREYHKWCRYVKKLTFDKFNEEYFIGIIPYMRALDRGEDLSDFKRRVFNSIIRPSIKHLNKQL